MKLEDFVNLTEAPISDIHVVSSDDHAVSFDHKDRKLINSPLHQARLVKAFSRTPMTFEIWFVENNLTNANAQRDNDRVMHAIFSVYHAGIYDKIDYSDLKIEGEMGKIKVVMMGNLSVTHKMPMTAWTLAHKIGHSFQDSISTTNYAEVNQAVKKIEREIQNLRDRASGSLFTMRSARDNLIDNYSYEAFPELFAQYLITGEVTIRNHPEASRNITNMITDLFKLIDGKVIVEI